MDNFTPSKPNRITPAVGPEHYRSYTISMPLSSHWRLATCEEVDCLQYLQGFVQLVDVSTDLGLRQYEYLAKKDKDRSPIIHRVNMYDFRFVYRPGTPCMRRGDHRLPIGREPLYLVQGGDWRGNPLQIPVRRHKKVDFWVEDFALNQIRISEVQKKG